MSDVLVGGFQSLAVMASLFSFLWVSRLFIRRAISANDTSADRRQPEIKPMAYRVRARDMELPVYVRRTAP